MMRQMQLFDMGLANPDMQPRRGWRKPRAASSGRGRHDNSLCAHDAMRSRILARQSLVHGWVDVHGPAQGQRAAGRGDAGGMRAVRGCRDGAHGATGAGSREREGVGMSGRVSPQADARARRIAYGLRTNSAVLEAGRMRTLGGVRLAHALERGFQTRSAVLSALVRREAALMARRSGMSEPFYVLAVAVFALALMLTGHVVVRVIRGNQDGADIPSLAHGDVWPDEVCEMCGRAGPEMDGGCITNAVRTSGRPTEE